MPVIVTKREMFPSNLILVMLFTIIVVKKATILTNAQDF